MKKEEEKWKKCAIRKAEKYLIMPRRKCLMLMREKPEWKNVLFAVALLSLTSRVRAK